jgi:molybdate transport system regulatory protein
MNIDGRFWLTKDGQSFLGSGRVELLEKIDAAGSINAAAKEMKMSYKAAWDRINAMNALADFPLIEKTTGGKGGGGTKLTPYAKELIATFRRLGELHRQFIDRFSEAGSDPQRLARILGRTFLTTSARNQLPCTIANIQNNGLHTELTLNLNRGDRLRSVISSKSVENMGLIVGCDTYAVIKSSDINIVSTLPSSDNADNILSGTIEALESSGNNIEIILHLNGGTHLVALEKQDSLQNLHIGMTVYALISPLHIIIGL